MTITKAHHPHKLTREQVLAKYGPVPNTFRTPEALEAFLKVAGLRSPCGVPLDPVRAMLVHDYGKATLKAQRMGSTYLFALGAILGLFAAADFRGRECTVAQRDGCLGPPNIIRNIQAQMHAAGVLSKETRPQGRGFVGSVHVYAPNKSDGQLTQAAALWIEQLYLTSREESHALAPLPANLAGADVPY